MCERERGEGEREREGGRVNKEKRRERKSELNTNGIEMVFEPLITAPGFACSDTRIVDQLGELWTVLCIQHIAGCEITGWLLPADARAPRSGVVIVADEYGGRGIAGQVHVVIPVTRAVKKIAAKSEPSSTPPSP